MKSLVLLALLFAGISPSWAAPVVSNVRVSQRTGTNLVDVYYNLSGSGAGGASVSVELSDNSGTSYGLPISSLSGHVGSGIANGTNRYLVWNAGTDRPNSFSTTMRLRLTAVDTPPVPTGMALIPAGSFEMGDQSNPLVGSTAERPVHSVYVSAFYMGKYEVTKELWDEVQAWGLNNGYTDLYVGSGKAADHPVHSMLWYHMVKWCNAYSERDNLTPCYTVSGSIYKTGNSEPNCNWNASGYRLPSEAEWEKAARGGLSGQNFPWGNTITHSQANYYSSVTTFPLESTYDLSPTKRWHPTYQKGGFPCSSPVGSFAANGYGLYDMCGNMREWCWDWYGSYPSTFQTDPRGPSSGQSRITRGGDWGGSALGSNYRGAMFCRAASRGGDLPFAPGYTAALGFRVARSSAP